MQEKLVKIYNYPSLWIKNFFPPLGNNATQQVPNSTAYDLRGPAKSTLESLGTIHILPQHIFRHFDPFPTLN